ncbi:MAG: TolC family protein, partial [Cyclobacteriaceae bacterium]|nr:TolC family protein [Cyclobacteriaceae bacterium]
EKKNNLISGLKELESQEKNMALAREVYDHTKIKYQEGLGSNLEVIEADNAYKTAQTNYFNALYEALIAKVELEKALGIIDSKYNF